MPVNTCSLFFVFLALCYYAFVLFVCALIFFLLCLMDVLYMYTVLFIVFKCYFRSLNV